jgi:putative PIN family toxin of toxin-antitoxin system
MDPVQVVLDTNVLVAGLRSQKGASFRLLALIGADSRFEINLSVPLVLEYESALKRPGTVPTLTHDDVDAVLDYLCSVGHHREIYFLWRPVLRDPKDDMVLEVAVEASCEFVVTHNLRDFRGIERYGVRALSPSEFLREIGEIQ